MALRVREASNDLVAIRRLWSLAWGNGRLPDDADQPLGSDYRYYGAELDGEIVGSYVIIDYRFSRGAATIPTAGIQGVAVAPEHRRGGVGNAMMVHSLEEMRALGYPMAALYAFREPYYRKYGYEFVGYRLEITCPQNRFPNLAPTLPVRQISADQLELLAPAYEAFANKVGGVNRRTPEQWQRRMGQNAPVIYAVGDPVRGYFWTPLDGCPWGTMTFGEFVYADLEAHRNLISLMGSLLLNRSTATWYEPSSSPFLTSLLDQGIQAKLERPAMFRVLDVPAALRLLVPEESGEFTLRVRDDKLPQNEGPWRVRFTPDGVEVDRAANADIEIDVRQLAQAFFGEPSLSSLLSMEYVRCESPRAAKEAAKLMPAMPVTCTEFF